MNEGPTFLSIVTLGLIPFCCYYLGVYIRKTVFPSDNSPSLRHQYLIAIPLSISVVAPLLLTIAPAIANTANLSAYLITMGIIIEHGIFMNEAVSKKFANNAING